MQLVVLPDREIGEGLLESARPGNGHGLRVDVVTKAEVHPQIVCAAIAAVTMDAANQRRPSRANEPNFRPDRAAIARGADQPQGQPGSAMPHFVS